MFYPFINEEEINLLHRMAHSRIVPPEIPNGKELIQSLLKKGYVDTALSSDENNPHYVVTLHGRWKIDTLKTSRYQQARIKTLQRLYQSHLSK